jgi:PAS domain S-box-containing protein
MMELLARLTGVVAAPDPARALADALSIAKELGIEETTSASDAWVTLTHGTRSLSLSRASAATSQEQSEKEQACLALLRVAFVRAVEREELLHVRERLQLLSAASFEGLFVHVDGVIVEANQRLCELTGYERSEFIGNDPKAQWIATEDLPEVVQRQKNGSEGEYVITAIRKDGSRFRAELQAKQGKLGDRPVRVVAVRDVTERERAQSMLRESELRLRNLAETTFDLTVFTSQGIILDVSGVNRMLGYTRKEVIGRSVLEYVPEREKPEVRNAQVAGRTGRYETALLAADGEEVPVEVVAVNATLHGKPVRMSAMRDLRAAKQQERERRALERAFEMSQRLESLGVLAGGIAHDFNNLLTVVLGQAELLQHRLAHKPEGALAQAIVSAAQRAAGLTTQMLAYAGRGEVGPRVPVDLSVLVQDLRTLLDAALSKKASLTLSLAPEAVVLGSRATLTQVVMNLLTNASDALGGEAGSINVRSAFVEVPGPRWRSALGTKVTPGDWVLLEVSDTGSGMDEATRARIFEPFFSTKPKGHGLGLAACVGIVSSHGGAILVESELGRGSTFSILLPAHAAEDRARAERRSAVPVRARQVLVVDDEHMVRTHLRDALTMHGYEVLEAEGGKSALELLARSEPSIVLLDMTMPDLSGAEVLRRIRAQGSLVPVVFSSGYHDSAFELDPSSFQGFLVKPYRLQELLDALERALRAAQECA